MAKIWRKLTILFLSGALLLGASNCALLGLEEEEDDNTGLLSLLALFVIANQNQGCQNTSGLVICIPPGLRQ
ncbi:MAG: hypothetical protein NXI24_22535 [bacterium]|nr:hypothetical protein [bacterium]